MGGFVALPVSADSYSQGPGGRRHAMDFYDFMHARWAKFRRLTEDEVDFLLDSHFELVSLMNGVGVECALRQYRLMVERENSLMSVKPGRSEISPKLRFRILSRDGFKCQYCGAQAPDVRLEVDHLIPVSQGGETVEDNLAAACWDCNRGKGAGPINHSED
jgi:hypothetical protein